VTEQDLHKSALHDRHVALGAEMGEAAGWEMPLSYGDAEGEAAAVRERGGIADVSHFGRVRIRGDAALDLLERACTADVARQEDNTTMPTLLLGADGRILDAARLIRLETFWVLVTSPRRREPLLAHLRTLADEFGAKVDDQTLKTSMLLAAGPDVPGILDAVLPFRASELAEGAVKLGSMLVARYIAERVGETRPWCARVQVPNMLAGRAWRFITDKAGENALPPVGVQALDALRAEAGVPRFGEDFDETSDPASAGLGSWIDWGHDFLGREALKPQG